MKEPHKTVSARGMVVDFELLRIKEEFSVAPTTIKRETKASRRRRRLSERSALETGVDITTQPAELPPEVNVDVQDAPAELPKIVRKKRE